jgi:hypothetical protein
MKELRVMCFAIALVVSGISSTALSGERQITFGTDANHSLDNNAPRQNPVGTILAIADYARKTRGFEAFLCPALWS